MLKSMRLVPRVTKSFNGNVRSTRVVQEVQTWTLGAFRVLIFYAELKTLSVCAWIYFFIFGSLVLCDLQLLEPFPS
jgi:hypothetical protein